MFPTKSSCINEIDLYTSKKCNNIYLHLRMDIILPSSLERSLASEAEAVREARAKIILAEGELKASRALKEASDVMSENRITLQVKS